MPERAFNFTTNSSNKVPILQNNKLKAIKQTEYITTKKTRKKQQKYLHIPATSSLSWSLIKTVLGQGHHQEHSRGLSSNPSFIFVLEELHLLVKNDGSTQN